MAAKRKASGIMGHNVLFLSAFLGFSVAGLVPGISSATQAETQLAAPMAHAYQALGTRYRYGGSSPATGFDCSGLVTHVFEQAWGIALPRNARGQARVGKPVTRIDLAPGDLVFYNTRNQPYSHVGIYLGDGRFIHAPRPGQRVRIESVESRYWKARYNGARRLDPPG
jgi:cell wall-associated NlpC family hydrolase